MKNQFKMIFGVVSIMLLTMIAFGAFAQEESELAQFNEDVNSILAGDSALMDETAAASTEEIVPFSCGVTNCAYLPILESAPTLSFGTVFHRTTPDCSGDEMTVSVANGGTINLGSGQTTIAFGARAEGYQGSSYRVDYVLDGTERPDLANSGTITAQTQDIFSITLALGGDLCAGTLPNGAYTARFFIDNQLITQYTAVIN